MMFLSSFFDEFNNNAEYSVVGGCMRNKTENPDSSFSDFR